MCMCVEFFGCLSVCSCRICCHGASCGEWQRWRGWAGRGGGPNENRDTTNQSAHDSQHSFSGVPSTTPPTPCRHEEDGARKTGSALHLPAWLSKNKGGSPKKAAG